MQSKVSKIEFKKDYPMGEGERRQIMSSFSVEFENGDVGEVSAKKGNQPWQVGDMAEYTKEPGREKDGGGRWPDRIKKDYAKGAFGGGGGGKWQPPTWETEKVKVPTMATSVACNAMAQVYAQRTELDLKGFPVAVDHLAKALAATMRAIGEDG